MEKLLEGRNILYLIERDLEYNPLLRAHLDKVDVHALEFSCDESTRDAFKKELHRSIAEDWVIVFIPGTAHARMGQTIEIPSRILQFLTTAGASLLPLYVDHPEETGLSVENRGDIERLVLSFGKLLEREGANLANFTENLLIAGEIAFSSSTRF